MSFSAIYCKWIPKRLLLEPPAEQLQAGSTITITIPEWLARDKGLLGGTKP